MIADIRSRTFVAVSRLVFQIGVSAASTSAVLISETGLLPSVGMT